MSFTHELQLGRFIAQGFFGDVHEGTDPVHGRVAVKVLRPYHGESPARWNQRKESLLSEAQNLSAAAHANVVRIHTIVRAIADDRLHMVIEFCAGGSLGDEFERGPILLSRVKSVLTDVCAGLCCIHHNGMIHRDIKPGNILVAGRRFKLGDFGLVSNALVGGYASAHGYADHLAPEFHSRGLTSVQTDVWALGMTIYRLIHGKEFYDEHFTGKDIPDLIQNGGFALNLPWLPHVPGKWRKFIRKAMHDDTDQRFETPFHMCQAAALLPTDPDWKCDYTTSTVTWTRQKGSRQLEVIWNILSPRRHTWTATSIGGLRSRTLAGCTTPIARSEAVNGLEAFFEAST